MPDVAKIDAAKRLLERLRGQAAVRPVLEAVETLSRFYLAVAYHNVDKKNRETEVQLFIVQRAPKPPDFTLLALSRSKRWSSPARVQIWVFVLYVWSLPWCEGAKLGVLDLCHVDLLKRGCASSGGFGAR